MSRIEVGKPMPAFCPACQAIPSAGWCKLPGCPMTAPATPSLVEAVARALFVWDHSESVAQRIWDTGSNARHISQDRGVYLSRARAAIAAMREPSEAMCRAADGALKSFVADTPVEERTWPVHKRKGVWAGYLFPPHLKARVRWRAMIDAALQPLPAPPALSEGGAG